MSGCRLLSAVGLCFLSAAALFAQQTPSGSAPAPRLPSQTAPPSTPVPPEARPPRPEDLSLPPENRGSAQGGRRTNDPTVPGPAIRDLIDQGGGRATASVAAAPLIPEIQIRARVFTKDRPPVAVVDVGGRSLTVRMGSEIHLPGTPELPTGVQLKVVELTLTELKLEVLKRNQTITLH